MLPNSSLYQIESQQELGLLNKIIQRHDPNVLFQVPEIPVDRFSSPLCSCILFLELVGPVIHHHHPSVEERCHWSLEYPPTENVTLGSLPVLKPSILQKDQPPSTHSFPYTIPSWLSTHLVRSSSPPVPTLPTLPSPTPSSLPGLVVPS